MSQALAYAQLDLFTGFYFCPSCRRLVNQLRRVRRLRVCPECYARYVPSEDRMTVEQGTCFWEWYNVLEKTLPTYWGPPRRRENTVLAGLNYCPVCTCGREIAPLDWAPDGAPASLFGPPRRWKCEHCEIEEQVRFLVQSTLRTIIKSEWDDEDWLDYLAQAKPRAFELKILPDLWFRLRLEMEARVR